MPTTRLFLSLLLTALLLPCASAGAETVPQMFRDLQAKAQVHAIIETLKVDLENRANPTTTDMEPQLGSTVTVKAKVLKVLRGLAKVKPGDVITIQYEYRPKPVGEPAAPAPIPVLKSGIQRQAWLNQKGSDYFVPAAYAYSFNAVPAKLPVTGGPVGE